MKAIRSKAEHLLIAVKPNRLPQPTIGHGLQKIGFPTPIISNKNTALRQVVKAASDVVSKVLYLYGAE